MNFKGWLYCQGASFSLLILLILLQRYGLPRYEENTASTLTQFVFMSMTAAGVPYFLLNAIYELVRSLKR